MAIHARSATEVCDTIESGILAVVESLQVEQPDLLSTMFRRMADELPEFDVVSEPELSDPMRRSCMGHQAAALAVVSGDRDVPEVMPIESLAETRAAARRKIPMSRLAQSYRICHAVLWERFMATTLGLGVDPAVTRGVLRHGWECLFAYHSRVVVLATREYERELERFLHPVDERKVAFVREILGGGWVAPEQLGYNLESSHVAVVAAGVNAATAVREFGRSLRCPLLELAVDDGTHPRAWLAGSVAMSALMEAARRTCASAQVQLAFGTPQRGVHGFRETSREADLAMRVGQRTGQPLTFYADVGVEALALADEPSARRFMTRELGSLTDSSPRADTLRVTLLTYLESAQNASSAAATLGVHERTIAYRLKHIAETSGASIPSRATELGLALRIHRVLGS